MTKSFAIIYQQHGQDRVYFRALYAPMLEQWMSFQDYTYSIIATCDYSEHVHLFNIFFDFPLRTFIWTGSQLQSLSE